MEFGGVVVRFWKKIGARKGRSVTDFDPRADNGNGEEHPDQVNNAIDGDPGTGWSMERRLRTG